MPPNQDDKARDVSTPDSDLSMIIQNDDVASMSSASETAPDEPSLYETIELPEEPTLKELVQRSCNCSDLSNVTKVRLCVIAADVGLQHLSHHTPMLTELILDGSFLSSLRDLGCALKSLKILRVNRCGLINLDGTNGFENLEELYLAKNKLTDISQCSNLTHLKVVDASNNCLSQIDNLYFLSLCDDLKELTLEGNEDITSSPDYRRTIKELIPQLVVLDGKPFPLKEKIAAIAGPSFLPPLENPKSPSKDSKNPFTVGFGPRILASSSFERPSSTLPSVRVSSQREGHGNRILPEIKNRSGSAQQQSNM